MEGALQQGAGYNNAFTYGILSGATEAAMEKLGGYAFGDATSLLGKATAGTKFGAWASKGLGKAITGAASEGVEEVLTDYQDVLNMAVTGVDTDIGANFRKALKNTGRTFSMGATVGSFMQGGQVLGQNISNKSAGRGGAKATRADSSLAYVSESAQNYGKNEAQNRKTDKAILQGLTDIGVQMSDMTKEERAVYRESLGEYKNVFNVDGSIKQDLENPDINTEAVSRKLKPISLTLKHAPIDSSVEVTDGARQAKAHIEKVLGSKANVVITSDSKETNAFYNPGENIFYINNDSASLQGAKKAVERAAFKASIHEMGHSAEGTRQYESLRKEIFRIALDENAPEYVKQRVGDMEKRMEGLRKDYADQMKDMSREERLYLIDTERNSQLLEDLIGEQYFIDKLAERNAPLVKKLISRFKGTIKKSATVDSESIKYLKKLVSRFEKALDNANGGVKISQIGNADDEREEIADSSQQTADSETNIRFSKNKEEYPYSMQTVIKEYIDSVDEKILKAAENLRENKNDSFVRQKICDVDSDFIAEVKDIFDLNVDKFTVNINSNAFNHIEKRHGLNGEADKSMANLKDLARIGYVIQNRDSLEPLYLNGEQVYSKEFSTKEGTPAPLMLLKKKINGTYYCAIAVTDGKYEKVWVQTAFINKRDGLTQILHDEISSLSQTSETVPASHPSSNSISEKSQKDNSFDENNSKNVSDERKSVKRSYEPGGESSKKITLGMSDAERTEILKDKKIQRIAEAQQFSQDVLEKIPEIHTWEDIDKYFGKQKRNLIQKIADEFKVFKNYENKDISLSFEFTNNNFRESYGKQKNKFVSFAKMFSVFDTVIENAVGIDVHKRPDYKPDPTLKNVYVLMSSFADGDYFIPVKLEIKEFNDKQSKLYVAIALDGIKKTEVSKQGTTEIGVAQGSRSVNISILDLMQKINPSNTNFTKYFPKNILTQAQKEILDSDTNNDERKSVKRSYELGKESEFEETLHDKYDNAGQEKTSEKQKGKKKSQYTAKGTIKNLIKDVFETYVTVENIDDDFAFVSKKAGNDVVTDIWKKLNDSNAKYDKKKFASLMADKILENTILADSKIYDADKLLKGFMHRIDLSSVADQIGSDIKRKINARWALKEGQEAISIEEIVQQLNTKAGVQISAQDLLGAVTEINSIFIKYC